MNKVLTIIGIKEETRIFSIYPNPSREIFKLQTDVKNTTLEIRDLTGKIVYTHYLNEQIVTIDLSEQPKGVYFVTTVTVKGSFTKNIILK